MNKLLLLTALFLFSTVAYAQSDAGLTDSKPYDNASVWSALNKSYYFTWGNTDTRYPKRSIPNKVGMENREGSLTNIRLEAWRGERINAQAVIYGKIDLKEVTLRISDLKSGKNTIVASAVAIHPVRYVMTDELNKDGKGGCGHRPDPTVYDSTLVADVLSNELKFDIQKQTTQPVWLTISVPADAQPGNYRATLQMTSLGQKAQTLQIEVKVLDRTLPSPAEWAFHLDLWQNPYAVARYHDVPLWSTEHFELMKPLMKMLANAGQKIVTASIMHHPWNAQTYDAFKSMVTRTKNLDGSWSFNYAVFDKWIHFMRDEVGITEQINCYTMVPWALNFDYFDVASNSIQFIHAQPGTVEFENYWMPFLKDFAKHLRRKGWFDITTIAMDERSLSDMQATIKLIKEADPDFKITLAGNYHAEIEADIFDYCVAYGQNFPDETKAERRKEGKPRTVYTCCTEPFPNTFTFSAPAEATWIGWHTAAGDYDGYLRWAYNSWTEKPLQDSRFRSWAAGDCFLVYPDAQSSIRFERLIEGIQDFEKIRILREQFAGNTQVLQQLNATIGEFSWQKNTTDSTESQVRKARKLLNSL